MRKPPTKPPDNVVPHPRYGVRIAPSGYNIPYQAIVQSFWGYARETIFPQTAIPADLSRQRYTVPRSYYVDILRQCRGCKRPFVFYAREQKHWYETLGFYIDADCVHCPECRRTHHRLRRRFRRYSEQVVRDDLSDAEFAVLVGDAVFLFQAGVLGEQRLRTLKNRAVARIPGDPATREILGAIEGRH